MAFVFALSALSALGGCNWFFALDPPSGDSQLLSAARACFDKGDFTCANTYYAALSSSYGDTKTSEAAFALLDQNGAGMANFVRAFGSGTTSIGKSVTKLAGYMATGAGETRRQNIYTAYQYVSSISNAQVKGLVRFVAGVALLAELIAEDAPTSGSTTLVELNDLTLDSTTCLASGGLPACAVTAGCDIPATGKLYATGATTLDIVTEPLPAVSTFAGTNPTLFMVQSALLAISQALSASELGSVGGLSASANSFSTSLVSTFGASLTNADESPCYRYGLISFDLGVNP